MGDQGAGTQSGQGSDDGTQAGGQQQGGDGGNGGGGGDDDDLSNWDKDRAARTIRNQRASEATLKQQLAEAQAAVKAHTEKDLSDQQRLTAQVADLTTRLEASEKAGQKLLAAQEFTAVASKLKFREPDLARRLLEEDDIDYDASGRPTNVDELLKKLAKKSPYLVKGEDDDDGQGDQGGGGGGGEGRGSDGTKKFDMNRLIRQGAGRQ